MENAHLLKKIHLEKDEKVGFGFSIIGGKGSELPPIIFDVIHNSPADRCSEVSIFMQKRIRLQHFINTTKYFIIF